MNRKNIIARLGLAATLALSASVSNAQDIHFSQFDMQPLVLNPAFTGMIDGGVRAGAIYRNQWKSVTIPYVTYGAYADMPLLRDDNGYLGAGLQLYKDQAGDGNLSNFSGLLSVAYHKFFGDNNDLAVGLQGGYAQKSIDLSKLYFGDEFQNGTFNHATSQEYQLGLGNSVNYYLVNAGLALSHSANNFSYVLGLSANNINQPNDAIEKKQSSQSASLGMRYTGVLGIDWRVGDRLRLRPAALFQSQSSATEFIVGNEFHYDLGANYGYKDFTPAVFLGAWMRSGDATMFTMGFEFKGVRVGLAYDYNISTLNNASNGNGGFEIAIKYISPLPGKFAGRRTIPCSRF